MTEYLVKSGLNYPTATESNKRAEPGDVVSDIPATSVGWLLAEGHIAEVAAPVAEAPPAAPAPVPGVVTPPVPEMPAQAIPPTPESVAAAEAEVEAAAKHLAEAQAAVTPEVPA